MALISLKKYKSAIDCFNIAIEMSPQSADLAYLLKGDALSELDEFNEALESYDESLNLNSENELVIFVFKYISNLK